MRKHWPKPRPYRPGLVASQQPAKSILTVATKVIVITALSIGYQAHKEAIDPYRDTPLQQQQRLRKQLSKKTSNKITDLDLGDWIL